MNTYLFGRSLGTFSHEALQRAESSRHLHALTAAPAVRFDGSDGAASTGADGGQRKGEALAHRAGVNCFTIDKFEGRYMLSGGADPSIKLWDLESGENTSRNYAHKPSGTVEKSSESHKFGLTHLSFYPFDSLAFLSSSYDHSLKIYSSTTLTTSASFDLTSVVYSHALSPIATHLLVACATQHPNIRLVDLRSGAAAHSVAGHQGAVLSVAWSPTDEHILASGGIDGTVRFWDVRRSAGCLGVLDLEDSVGVGGENGLGAKARSKDHGKAHIGACNGVVWTEDGKHLVTAGHDERVRVWDVGSGANTLAHFGPSIKNTNLSTVLPLVVPQSLSPPPGQVMLYPNEKEILVCDLLEGTIFKKLRAAGGSDVQGVGRNAKSRITGLAWRAGDVEVYSAHSDGVIRAWMPDTDEGIEEDEEEKLEGDGTEEGDRKRKREALDEVFRSMTKTKITFT